MDKVIDVNDYQLDLIIKRYSLLGSTISDQNNNIQIYSNYKSDWHLEIKMRSSGYRKVTVDEELFKLIGGILK